MSSITTCPPACIANCFEALDAHFAGRRPRLYPLFPSPPPAAAAATAAGVVPPPPTLSECPFFVTLKKWDARARDYDLRGCIGTLAPLPVDEIVDYAFKSAFEDSRFEPLTKGELPQLKISVSLLVNYESAVTPVDWVVGKHGIILTFRADGRTYRGTFLPEVAPEQGWDQEETLAGLVRKAGYRRSPVPKDVRDSMRVERFQSVKGSMTYDEWRRWTEEAAGSHARLA